jgi:Uma2 family endonuclease
MTMTDPETKAPAWLDFDAIVPAELREELAAVTAEATELEATDKKNIGRLLEAYFEETRTRFWGLGSTTFRQQGKSGGTEPDECYCLDTEKDIPDLAIEIVVTSGGVDKLAVYQRLGVREVWFWYRDRFEVYHLSGERYEAVPESQLLPELNLALLATHVVHPDPLDALLSSRAEVRAGGSCG